MSLTHPTILALSFETIEIFTPHFGPSHIVTFLMPVLSTSSSSQFVTALAVQIKLNATTASSTSIVSSESASPSQTGSELNSLSKPTDVVTSGASRSLVHMLACSSHNARVLVLFGLVLLFKWSRNELGESNYFQKWLKYHWNVVIVHRILSWRKKDCEESL